MTVSHSAALRQTRAIASALMLAASAAAATPEQRAIDYLAGEVARWAPENGCFSCHNNGDAARALYDAAKRGYSVPKVALEATTQWLQQPANWKKGRSNPAFSDQKLADIQFAAALADAPVHDAPAAGAAAKLVAAWQESDGSWRIDAEAGVGSPVTWGATLATHMAQRALTALDGKTHAPQVKRAQSWLNGMKPESLLDASAILLACPDDGAVRRRMVDTLLRAQTSDGGWGPQPGAPAEAFDTAVALLALAGAGEANARGRAYLIRTQLENGGWPPTTRPAGAQSYAQHISTSAWAALALMITDPKRK